MASRRGGRAGGTTVMGQLCHQQPPTATPPRSLGSSGGLPGSPLLLLLLLLLASSMCACKGEEHPPATPSCTATAANWGAGRVTPSLQGGWEIPAQQNPCSALPGCGAGVGSDAAVRDAEMLGRQQAGRVRGLGLGMGGSSQHILGWGGGGLLPLPQQDCPVLPKPRSGSWGKWLLFQAESLKG